MVIQKMTSNKPMKGMIVEVLRSKYEATNNGITSTTDKVLLVGDGVPEIFEAPGLDVLKLVRRKISSEEYLHAEPIQDVPEGHVGWMSGGNFIYSSDSRFPSKQPISVHDRSETTEMYNHLSV